MSDNSLKIGVIYTGPPDVYPCALDETCPRRGYLVDIMNLACDQLKLDCFFVKYNGTTSYDYGDVLENGTATGLVRAVESGEFDTSLPTFTPTYRRSQAISFSDMTDTNDIILMTRAPTGIPKNFNLSLIYTFQTHVWIVFIIMLLLSAGILRYILEKRIYSPGYNRKSSYFDLCMHIITLRFRQSMLNQGIIRYIIGGWILGTVVLTSAYNGILFAQTILTQYTLPFTDLDTFLACLERKECRLVTYTTEISYVQHLLDPAHDLGRRVRQSTKDNQILIRPRDIISKLILQEKDQYLVSMGSRSTRMRWMERNRECSYYTADIGYSEWNTFPVAKNSTYIKTLNKLATAVREHGIKQALVQRYVDPSLCERQWNKKYRSSQGHVMASVTTMLCFYACGILVSMIAFGLERGVMRVLKVLIDSIYAAVDRVR